MKKKKTASSFESSLTEEQLNDLKTKAMDILTYCRQSLLNKHPFAGTIALGLELKPVRDLRCPTAMTDGTNIFFDIDFLSRLSQDEREFVVGHEVWHVIMMHFLRGTGKEHDVFNIATDMEVNQLLESDGFVAPADVIFPNSRHSRKCEFNFADGLSAEEYYEELLKVLPKSKKAGEGKNGNGGAGSQGSGKRSGSQCNGQFDKHFDKNEDYSEEAAMKELEKAVSDKYGTKGFDKDFTPSSFKSESEERNAMDKVREKVVSAAQTVERTRGTLPGHIQRIVGKLLEPKMPWKELLAAFVTSSFYNKTNWNMPNRRFAYAGTYLPSHAGECMKIAVGIDTSGSCSNDCERFLTELNAIAKTFGAYELHVIQCDTDVKDYKVFDENNQLDPEHNGVEFKGFGGTELHPIFKYINDNELDVDAAVIFTDGECETFEDDSTIELPVLWALVGSKQDHSNLKIGQQLHIIDD